MALGSGVRAKRGIGVRVRVTVRDKRDIGVEADMSLAVLVVFSFQLYVPTWLFT